MLMPPGNRITANDNAAETGARMHTSAGTNVMSDARFRPAPSRVLGSPSRLHHQLKRC
jgi:hypothetical protein